MAIYINFFKYLKQCHRSWISRLSLYDSSQLFLMTPINSLFYSFILADCFSSLQCKINSFLPNQAMVGRVLSVCEEAGIIPTSLNSEPNAQFVRKKNMWVVFRLNVCITGSNSGNEANSFLLVIFRAEKMY